MLYLLKVGSHCKTYGFNSNDAAEYSKYLIIDEEHKG